MGRTNSFKNEVAGLIFNNTAIVNIGSGLQPSTTTGVLYVSLYSVMPTETTSGTEATYAGYARASVVRTNLGWTISGTNPVIVSNTSKITFGQSSSSETIVGVGISYTLTGDAKYFGQLSENINIINGYKPEIQIGQIKINMN
jgi:hypothetical protein